MVGQHDKESLLWCQVEKHRIGSKIKISIGKECKTENTETE